MCRNEHGIAMVFFAIMMVVVIGLGAMVVDLSQAYSIKTRIKNAVDLSTIAGISQLVNQSSVVGVKNVALNYLNDNLAMTIPSFSPLVLSSEGLSIQVGVYDPSSMNFTWNENSPSVNAIMISYSYYSMNILGSVFMIDNIQISDSSTALKQPAGGVPPGGGFPLAIQSSLLAQAKANNNMLDLVTGGIQNSYFSAFKSNDASANDIKDILDHFQNPLVGEKSPSLTVGQEFQINNGSLTSVYMALNESFFEGKTFVSPIVQADQNFTNMIKVQGFVGLTINDIYKVGNDYHIAATIIPGYIDNTWSGLTISAGPGNISVEDQSLLATSFGLVQ